MQTTYSKPQGLVSHNGFVQVFHVNRFSSQAKNHRSQVRNLQISGINPGLNKIRIRRLCCAETSLTLSDVYYFCNKANVMFWLSCREQRHFVRLTKFDLHLTLGWRGDEIMELLVFGEFLEIGFTVLSFERKKCQYILLQLPREEAMTLLGSLLCFPNLYPNMPLHQPGHQTNEYQHKNTGKDIKVCISALQALFVK